MSNIELYSFKTKDEIDFIINCQLRKVRGLLGTYKTNTLKSDLTDRFNSLSFVNNKFNYNLIVDYNTGGYFVMRYELPKGKEKYLRNNLSERGIKLMLYLTESFDSLEYCFNLIQIIANKHKVDDVEIHVDKNISDDKYFKLIEKGSILSEDLLLIKTKIVI